MKTHKIRQRNRIIVFVGKLLARAKGEVVTEDGDKREAEVAVFMTREGSYIIQPV